MTDYDALAPYYDAIMGDRSDIAAIIGEQIMKFAPEAKTVLELGCGTGEILSLLKPAYSKFGIEQSPEMLKIAQQKLPESTFLQQSIAGFEIKQNFDVIFCVFDTINHLTRFGDWQKLFASAKHHLSLNGIFIFDMNTIGRLQTLAALPNYIQEFDDKTMEMTIIPVKDNEVEWQLLIQDPGTDGVIQVYEEYVREAAFPLADVRSELKTQGFTVLSEFDSAGDTPPDQSDRIYFVCC